VCVGAVQRDALSERGTMCRSAQWRRTNYAPVTGLVTKQFSIVNVEVAVNGWPLNTPMIG